MARSGRKRNVLVEREKNGRAKRVYENPRRQVSEQPHRVVVPVEFRQFPEAESEFGRLMLLGRISPAQHAAGKAYMDLADQYRQVKGYPPLTAQAMDLTSVRGGLGPEVPSHVVNAITERYNRAFESICGQRAQKAVADYAIRDQKIADFEGLKYLSCGLSDLVAHFGIDPGLQISSGH